MSISGKVNQIYNNAGKSAFTVEPNLVGPAIFQRYQ